MSKNNRMSDNVWLNLISAIAILILFFAISCTLLMPKKAQAQVYNVIPERLTTSINGNVIYESESGIIMQTDSQDSDCTLPRLTPMRLDTALYTLTYESEYNYVDNNNQILSQMVEVVCTVVDYMGAFKTNNIAIISNTIFDLNGNYLYLDNVWLYEGNKPTGQRFDMNLLLESGIFKVKSINGEEL